MSSTRRQPVTIVCISDTHGQHQVLDLPRGDILIHAGDFTYFGRTEAQVSAFAAWIAAQPFRHVILVAGNHELAFDPATGGRLAQAPGDGQRSSKGENWLRLAWARLGANHCHYLENAGLALEGIKFFGAPQQPPYTDMAFNVEGEDNRAEFWSAIDDDTEVLITHAPPHGICDQAHGDNLGCRALSERVKNLRSLKLHVFGHIHEAYGKAQRDDGVWSVNASICDWTHRPANQPVLVVAPPDGPWSVVRT